MLFPIGSFIGFTGFAIAITGPYLSVFLTRDLRASPLRTSAFLFLAPLASVVLSTLLGYLSDRRAMRRSLLVFGSLAGTIGYAVYALVPNYWVLLAVAMTLLGVSASGPPQTFAYARELLDGERSSLAPLAISTLRMVVSAAWVFGPPLAGFLLGVIDFKGLYLLTSSGFLISAVIALTCFRTSRGAQDLPGGAGGTPKNPSHQGAAVDPDEVGPSATSRPILLTALGFVFMQCSLSLANLALPLYVDETLHASVRDAGVVMGICAALEIPLMPLFGALASRWPPRRLMLVGAGFGVSYFMAAGLAQNPWHLMLAQVLNACFISSVLGLGITYFQDLLPSAPGQATTMYSNTNRLAAMLAGPIFGLVLHLGYRSAYAVCFALCLAGLGLLAGVRVRPASLH